MFTLRVLGGARIDGPQGRLGGEVAQRHRLALLARLAVARGSAIPRQRLVALLWPEASEREGRHLLNVSVHVLRKALGERALRSEGGDLRLDGDVIRCDLVAFRDALTRDDAAGAVAQYAGPLLDGFFLDGTLEFAQWQHAERMLVEEEYAGALEALAHRAEAAGDWPDAVRWWQVLWTRSPERERTTIRLMRALEAGGDRAGALRVADAHTTHLAEEFQANAGPEVTALAAHMREPPAGAGTLTIESAPPVPAGPPALASPQPSWWGRRRAQAGVMVIAIGALAFSMLPWRGPAHHSLAVLPFVDMSPQRDRAYLSDGMTEELLNALARIPGLHVAARSSSFQFREPGVDVRQVGEQLGVHAVVEGSVRLDGERIRVTAQLIEARTGYHLWSDTYDRRVEDVFAVQEEIARTVARALGAQLGRGVPDTLVRRATAVPRAYDLYLRGRHAWMSRTTDGMWSALQAFQEAVNLDPGYAAAHAGLADTWQLLPDYGSVNARLGLARARTAALRAIALDSTLAEAHASLGAVLDDYDHDRAGAEHAYRTAILLNPGYATARQWLAIHLADEGRHEEAAEEIERARRLDPLSRIIHTAAGAIRYFARDYDGAIAEYRAVVEEAPDFALGWALMGRVFLVQGNVDSALAVLDRAARLSGRDPSYLSVQAAALAAAGRTVEARALADSIRSAPPDGYVPFCELASAFVFLDDHAAALELFERGVEARDPAIKHIAVEPLYDGVRGQARFQALMKRAGFP